MSRQFSLGKFLGLKRDRSATRQPGSINAGKKQCPWRHEFFFSRGFGTHIKGHQANNEVPRKQAKFGRVKLTNVDSALSSTTTTATSTPDVHDMVMESDVEIEELLSDSDDDGIELVEPDAQTDAPGNTSSICTPNWKVADIVKVMREYDEMNGKDNKAKFICNVKDQYRRPRFQKTTLARWLAKQDGIEASAKLQSVNRRHLSVPRESCGQYPDMEHHLAVRIRDLRSCGIVVQSWIVNEEAKILLHELYPIAFPNSPDLEGNDEETYGFKCSNTWRNNFFKRHNFSLKTIGKKVNMIGTEEEKMASIKEYHLRTRCLQLSGNKDPVYGLTSPYYAISHDQVPLELADSNGSTMNTTGCPYVYDAIGKDSDVKRFCTLSLFEAMRNREDGLNIPMPHLVFEGAFRPGSEWHDQEEVSLWDDRVVVSFQPNAWVDAPTHMFGLKMVLGPINAHLGSIGMKGVTFEDNVSAQKTLESLTVTLVSSTNGLCIRPFESSCETSS